MSLSVLEGGRGEARFAWRLGYDYNHDHHQQISKEPKERRTRRRSAWQQRVPGRAPAPRDPTEPAPAATSRRLPPRTALATSPQSTGGTLLAEHRTRFSYKKWKQWMKEKWSGERSADGDGHPRQEAQNVQRKTTTIAYPPIKTFSSVSF